MEKNTAIPFALRSVEQYRAEAQRRRAAAYAAPYDIVSRLSLRPVTPASYSRMFAAGNAFAYGREPRAADIRNYVWFHWPRFTTDPALQKDETARCERELAKRVQLPLRAIVRLLRRSKWSPRKFALRYRRLQAARFEQIVAEVREVWLETFADAPPAGSGFYIGATLQAQFVHLFGHELGWTPEYTAEFPLRQAYQLLRVIRASRLGAAYIEQDPQEDALIAAELATEGLSECLPANNPPAAAA